MPIIVFNMNKRGALKDVIMGKTERNLDFAEKLGLNVGLKERSGLSRRFQKQKTVENAMKEVVQNSSRPTFTSLKSLKEHLGKVRTGRANVSLLDGVMVDYYGTPTPIKQVANLSTPDARTIQVQAWEAGHPPAVEKAIIGGNLGLTPMNDGKLIRVPVPALNEERRKELVKQCKKMAEESQSDDPQPPPRSERDAEKAGKRQVDIAKTR